MKLKVKYIIVKLLILIYYTFNVDDYFFFNFLNKKNNEIIFFYPIILLIFEIKNHLIFLCSCTFEENIYCLYRTLLFLYLFSHFRNNIFF